MSLWAGNRSGMWASQRNAVGGNDIGVPGAQGFGVGVYPAALPAGMARMAGSDDAASDNYGNYQYSDGSVMCWIPAFFYRIGHTNNPTYAAYGLNSVDVLPLSAFSSVAAANAAGYALHRAFYDGGAQKIGFWVDKYQCSNNGGVASSIRFGAPLSSNAAHNPFGALNGAPTNNYGGAFAAAKTRGAAFFPCMCYMHHALALLSLAHGQAATSATHCAWHDPAGNTNFPKGNNNDALGDANDGTVAYVSDGYSNCGQTGSGAPFSKTTHNGQACGVADLNGNVWEVAPGVTYVAAAAAITGATNTSPVQLTVVGHGRTTGDQVMVTSINGMTELNNRLFTVTVVDADHVTLDGCNGTAFGVYVDGGSLTAGTLYALSTDAVAADLTGGNSLVTDAWGAAGLAAHSAPLPPKWRTDYPNNNFGLRHGNGAAKVFDNAVSGDAWMSTGVGLTLQDGISGGGTSLFGVDYHYQYIRHELCPIAGGSWLNSANAGVFAVLWNSARSYSLYFAGFRAASYL